MTSFETSVEPGQHSGECINLVGLLTKVMRLFRIRYELAAHTIVFQYHSGSRTVLDENVTCSAELPVVTTAVERSHGSVVP
jgi:hypothetical protein